MTRTTRHLRTVVLLGGTLALILGFIGSARASDPASLEQLRVTRSCANCDLSDADLSGRVLAKADLSGANLSGAKLYKANLTNAKLTAANFFNCDLTGANLKGAVGVNLTGAKTDARTICPNGLAGPCQ
jgi:uncharacterized protein YjbI with pentapeptide repeats